LILPDFSAEAENATFVHIVAFLGQDGAAMVNRKTMGTTGNNRLI
jgi:hypothetical protein